jgi:hypothetical protein
MGMIMIRCPVSGRDVSTGIETSGVDELPSVNATMLCPACGRMHGWTKHDAWLADSGEHYRAAASAERPPSTSALDVIGVEREAPPRWIAQGRG